MTAHDKRWTGRCTGCGREGGEVGARTTHGLRVLCAACTTKPYRMPSATALDPPPDDAATIHRRAIIDHLAPAGAMFDYLDADTFAAACPICLEPMRVQFRGALVDLCCTAGCAEADVVRVAFGIEVA